MNINRSMNWGSIFGVNIEFEGKLILGYIHDFNNVGS